MNSSNCRICNQQTYGVHLCPDCLINFVQHTDSPEPSPTLRASEEEIAYERIRNTAIHIFVSIGNIFMQSVGAQVTARLQANPPQPIFYTASTSAPPGVDVFTLMLQMFQEGPESTDFWDAVKVPQPPPPLVAGTIPDDSVCCICLESKDLNALLPCGHAHHKECIERWFVENAVCPVCKEDYH